MREWISNRTLEIAWFSIDRGDNDPIRFWTYVIAAIQTVEPDVGKTILASIQTPKPAWIKSLITELINEISLGTDRSTWLPSNKKLILVLDDYHLITESSVHDSALFLFG